MIRSQSRAGWFGASDTARIMGSWETKTFAGWWAEKLGLVEHRFKTRAMQAGTHYEHRILDAIGVKQMDRQVRRWWYRLRVNLDGEDTTHVYEVKTYGTDDFKITKAYWYQAQVEMFATGKRLFIVAYRLLPEDYDNYFNDIDPDRLSFHPIQYDPDFIHNHYLPRLKALARALRRKEKPVWPLLRAA